MNCIICLDNINILYYKSKCNCKAYYHYDCIIKWYKIKTICPICKKPHNINIQQLVRKQYNFYKFSIIYVIIAIFLLYFIFFYLLK